MAREWVNAPAGSEQTKMEMKIEKETDRQIDECEEAERRKR